MAIPSIALVTYSKYKFHGIIGGMMGQADYIVDFDASSYEIAQIQTKDKIIQALENSASIRRTLIERAQLMKQQASMNGEILKYFIENSQCK